MRRLMLLAPLLLAGCDGPAVPPMSLREIYEFRLPTDPPSVLRWPSGSRIDVFVFSADATGEARLAQAFENAADAWNDVALYREYELARTERIGDADVLLRWSDEPTPVDFTDCPPQLALAVTTFCLDEAQPSRLSTFPLLPPATSPGNIRMVVTILGTADDATANRLVAHELGHVLGLARHSPDPDDLMFASGFTRLTPSRRDEATVHILYHTTPAITP